MIKKMHKYKNNVCDTEEAIRDTTLVLKTKSKAHIGPDVLELTRSDLL